MNLSSIHTPANPRLKWSHDREVSFDPITHTYMRKGKRLIGVTTYIEQFKNKFDAESVAVTYAAKRGLDPVKVLAEWKQRGDLSRDSGHAVHNVFERYSDTREIVTTGEFPKEQVAVKFIHDYFETGRLIPVIAESIVYNDDIAYMRDQVVKDKHNNYYILDWKTNSEIKTDSWGRWMKHPYNFLPDATFYHYSLQLRIYQHLSLDYQIKDCYIVHIGDTNYQLHRAKDIPLSHIKLAS